MIEKPSESKWSFANSVAPVERNVGVETILKRAADAAFLQEPEQAFNCDIDHTIGSFLAGRTMNDMRNSLHGGAYCVPVRDTSPYNLQLLMRFRHTVVTQGANGYVGAIAGLKNVANEMGSYFAGGSGY